MEFPIGGINLWEIEPDVLVIKLHTVLYNKTFSMSRYNAHAFLCEREQACVCDNHRIRC